MVPFPVTKDALADKGPSLSLPDVVNVIESARAIAEREHNKATGRMAASFLTTLKNLIFRLSSSIYKRYSTSRAIRSLPTCLSKSLTPDHLVSEAHAAALGILQNFAKPKR
jgi:hypothetical protein